MNFTNLINNYKIKFKKIKTFVFLSFLYLALVSFTLLILLNKYTEVIEIKFILQETEVIKSIQRIVNYNFENVNNDILLLKTELEALDKSHPNSEIFFTQVNDLFYNIASSKKNYYQMSLVDTSGNYIFSMKYGDTIPTVEFENEFKSNFDKTLMLNIIDLSDEKVYSTDIETTDSNKIQIIKFVTPVYFSNNNIKGYIIVSYKFSEIIKIFNDYIVNHSGNIFLIDEKSKLIFRGGVKSEQIIFIDSAIIYFKDIYTEEWNNIEFKNSGDIISDKGIFVYEKINFTDGYFDSYKKSENLLKWKILSFTTSEDIRKAIRSANGGWLYLLVIASFLIILLIYLLTKNIQIRNSAFKEIYFKNKQLEIKNEEILKQRDELIQSNALIINQKNILENQTREMKSINIELQEKQRKYTESLIYSEKIQATLMPSYEFLSSIFKEYFVYLRPKEIVSGDFYWANKFFVNNSEIIVFTVADCTGHGIPGAFVSILGISLLNEILYRNFVSSPSQILEEIRIQIKYLLKQTSIYTSREDGIDMALCFWDKTNSSMQFSGANRPLLKINKDKKIELYEPTYNPIGIYFKETKFNNQQIDIEIGDKIYLFTDGLSDQFNKKQEKYKESRLKHFVNQVYDLTMAEQKKEFIVDFENWKKDTFQIDDVLLLGIKI